MRVPALRRPFLKTASAGDALAVPATSLRGSWGCAERRATLRRICVTGRRPTTGCGACLPSEQAGKGGGCGAVIQSNGAGLEGGQILVEETVKRINALG